MRPEDAPLRIRLSDERRDGLVRRLTEMFAAEFDEELSTFRAERLVRFFVSSLGPTVYNQAIQDARKFMLERLDDLDATFHELDRDAPEDDAGR